MAAPELEPELELESGVFESALVEAEEDEEADSDLPSAAAPVFFLP